MPSPSRQQLAGLGALVLACFALPVVLRLFGIGWTTRRKSNRVPLLFDVCRTSRDYIVQTTTTPGAAPDSILEPLEQAQWAAVKQELKRTGTSLHIFYHVSTWRKFWWDVISEQLTLLESSLLQVASLHINVVGSRSDFEAVKLRVSSSAIASNQRLLNNRVHWSFNETVQRYAFKHSKGKKREAMAANTQLSEGEYSTLERLRNHCRNDQSAEKKTLVLYLHNKGACCSRTKSSNRIDPTNDNVCAWREVMNALALQYPSLCAKALLHGNYAACGFEFMMDYPRPHYSGNFWWARCEHVLHLTELPDRFDSYGAELWLFNVSGPPGSYWQSGEPGRQPGLPARTTADNRAFGRRCGYSTYNCCMDLYKSECTREHWSWRALELLSAGVGETRVVLPSNADIALGVNASADTSGSLLPKPGECY